MKRKLLIIFGIVAILAVLSAGTIAYFTAETTAKNVISTGNVQMVVHETTASGAEFPKEGVVIMPGDTVSKIVTVENTGNQPFYLRIRLTQAVNDEKLTADGCLNIQINRTYWLEKDGYYYYYRALNAGEKTEPLFSEVNFDLFGIDNRYIGKNFTLDVDASAVQSKNNGGDVLNAIGWPEEGGKS